MLRMKRLAALWVMIPAAIACTTYSSAAGKPIAPERRVRVRFSTPITLRFECNAVDSVVSASTSAPVTVSSTWRRRPPRTLLYGSDGSSPAGGR